MERKVMEKERVNERKSEKGRERRSGGWSEGEGADDEMRSEYIPWGRLGDQLR